MITIRTEGYCNFFLQLYLRFVVLICNYRNCRIAVCLIIIIMQNIIVVFLTIIVPTSLIPSNAPVTSIRLPALK